MVCQVHVHLRGVAPVEVRSKHAMLEAAVESAADRVKVAVRRSLEKARDMARQVA